MAIGISRRQFIFVLTRGIRVATRRPGAAAAGRTARIGIVRPPLDNPVVSVGYPAFIDELKKSGFSEGQNLTIEVSGMTRTLSNFSLQRPT